MNKILAHSKHIMKSRNQFNKFMKLAGDKLNNKVIKIILKTMPYNTVLSVIFSICIIKAGTYGLVISNIYLLSIILPMIQLLIYSAGASIILPFVSSLTFNKNAKKDKVALTRIGNLSIVIIITVINCILTNIFASTYLLYKSLTLGNIMFCIFNIGTHIYFCGAMVFFMILSVNALESITKIKRAKAF